MRDRCVGQAAVSRLDVIDSETFLFLPGLAGLIQLLRRAASKCSSAQREKPNEDRKQSHTCRSDKANLRRAALYEGGERESIRW
jgi:hypothetical protein